MKYFTFEEFFYSEIAKANNIPNTTNDSVILDNIKNLTENLLDVVREEYGRPITISSGYRCPKLNSIIKGASKTSDHMTGQSADLIVKDGAHGLKVLAGIILRSDMEFDQIIWEHGGQWLHVSLRNGSPNRKSVLKDVKGGYAKVSQDFIKECIESADKECPRHTYDFNKCKLV